MNRLVWGAVALVLVCVCCTPHRQSRSVVLLLDLSTSVADREETIEICQSAIDGFVGSLRLGDSLAVAEIGATPRSRFSPAEVVSFEDKSTRLADQAEYNERRKEVRAVLARMSESRMRADESRIAAAITGASDWLANTDGQKYLLICSDGLEFSKAPPRLNFERAPIPAFEDVEASLSKNGQLASLDGVFVQFAGIGSPNSTDSEFERNRAFWLEYFGATRARDVRIARFQKFEVIDERQ